jgi:hypothetical protein
MNDLMEKVLQPKKITHKIMRNGAVLTTATIEDTNTTTHS